MLPLGDGRDILGRAEHGQATDARADLQRIVIEEADRLQPEVRSASDLACDQHAGLASADQQYTIAFVAADLTLAIARLALHAAQRTNADEREEREHEVHREHAERDHDDRDRVDVDEPAQHMNEHEQRRRGSGCDEDSPDVGDADVAPRHARHAERREPDVGEPDDVRPRREQHA